MRNVSWLNRDVEQTSDQKKDRVEKKEMYAQFQEYARSVGEHESFTSIAFHKKMQDLGHEPKKTGGYWFYCGFRRKVQDSEGMDECPIRASS